MQWRAPETLKFDVGGSNRESSFHLVSIFLLCIFPPVSRSFPPPNNDTCQLLLRLADERMLQSSVTVTATYTVMSQPANMLSVAGWLAGWLDAEDGITSIQLSRPQPGVINENPTLTSASTSTFTPTPASSTCAGHLTVACNKSFVQVRSVSVLDQAVKQPCAARPAAAGSHPG